jgi:GDPmannose 4,6-dehydratase
MIRPPSRCSRFRSVIIGITGQDGAYLSSILLQNGHQVYGVSRKLHNHSLDRLKTLGIADKVHIMERDLRSPSQVSELLQTTTPEYVFHLGGHTSVGSSFSEPYQTLESILQPTVNFLEVLRRDRLDSRYFNAGSSEMFGNSSEDVCNEDTPLRPCSPYGVAKCAAFSLVRQYRDSYGVKACTGIMFNHESPLRGDNFVSKKIVNAASLIAKGKESRLALGDLSVCRDWGWAPDYSDAIWRIAQNPECDDFVISTGSAASLEDFTKSVFREYGLDWATFVKTDPAAHRPSEIRRNCGDPTKAQKHLNWRSTKTMPEIAKLLVRYKENKADAWGRCLKAG